MFFSGGYHVAVHNVLKKLASPWNRSQDKYNQDQYKGDNQNWVYWPILGSYKNWQIIYCIESRKQHKSSDTYINFHIKYHAISNIALNIRKYISDNYYGAIPTIDNNAENEYYIVKWTSDSYTLQSSHKIVRYVIKSGELVCGAVHLNTFAHFRQLYTPYRVKGRVKTFRLNTVIITKVKCTKWILYC